MRHRRLPPFVPLLFASLLLAPCVSGVLRLDLAAGLHGVAGTTATSGTLSTSILVPPLRAFVGVALAAQGLALDGGSPRLTNGAALLIR